MSLITITGTTVLFFSGRICYKSLSRPMNIYTEDIYGEMSYRSCDTVYIYYMPLASQAENKMLRLSQT